MNESEEVAHLRGRRSVWTSLLQEAVRELGMNNRPAEAWIVEREQAIAALRRLCDHLGDNDWPNDLYLADIISNHVYCPPGAHADDMKFYR